MKLGFIGLGRMGAGMAGRLCQAGCDLAVYNRSADRLQPLLAQGAKQAKSIAEACAADAVFTMLADDAAVGDVVLGSGGILENLKPGAIHVSCSTVSVALSERLSQAHGQRQQGYIAAPVFGRPDAAAAGRLYVVAAGRQNLIEKVQPLLDILGQRTFRVSEDPQAANLVKLSGNFLLATVIESLGEALALAEKGGVDRHQFLDLFTSSLFNIPVYKNYGSMIADRHFEPAGFAAHLGQKDMRLVLAAAEELKVPLPFASILRDRFLELAAHGGENLDWSAVGSLAAKDAALIP
jgi:3-hydroxyisobutyrate dehydrogenase-like beta-hydroxyacid dehydrogenase